MRSPTVIAASAALVAFAAALVLALGLPARPKRAAAEEREPPRAGARMYPDTLPAGAGRENSTGVREI